MSDKYALRKSILYPRTSDLKIEGQYQDQCILCLKYTPEKPEDLITALDDVRLKELHAIDGCKEIIQGVLDKQDYYMFSQIDNILIQKNAFNLVLVNLGSKGRDRSLVVDYAKYQSQKEDYQFIKNSLFVISVVVLSFLTYYLR